MGRTKLAKIENGIYKKMGKFFYKRKKYLKYYLFKSTQKYDIYSHVGGNKKIVAAYNNVICVQKNKTTLYLFPNYKNTFFKYKIKLTKRKFEGLIDKSKIDLCFIIPYCRKCSKSDIVDSWRLVIITNKCQVFHNFPNRSNKEGVEGHSNAFDIIRFEESVVWDLPGKKYPSKNVNVDENEFYFPCLSESSYRYYPAINKKSKYGNNGFPKFLKTKSNETISRFYFPKRCSTSNPFFYLDGLEIDTKITLLGTYRSNTNESARIVVFATIDGGRNWFAKYEFSDYGQYDFRQGDPNLWGLNHGNPVDLTGFKINHAEIKNIKAYKRSLTLDFKTNNYQSFNQEISIKDISSTSPAVVETLQPHNLENGNIIVLKSKKTISNIDFLLNNECCESKPGNGVYLKVKVLNNYKFELYENVSNVDNALPCRHIHFIDRIRDGWTIGTGEVYPNGWILLMQSLEGDTYSEIDVLKPFKVKQLTFSKNSVQRAMGIYFYEREKENYFIYASDHDLLERTVKLSDGCTINRNSTGVYIGKSTDINDYQKTYPVYETNEPCLFFKKIDGTYIYGGQRGEVAFGYKNGTEWETIRIEKAIKKYYGETFDFLVFDNLIFVKK